MNNQITDQALYLLKQQQALRARLNYNKNIKLQSQAKLLTTNQDLKKRFKEV